MKTISVSELTAILLNVKSAQPISFSALVDARAKKTGNPYGEVLKLSKVNAFICNYESSVNRQLDREKSHLAFMAGQRKWGEKISLALVEDKGEHYLSCKIEKSSKPIYLIHSNLGLKPLSKHILEPWLPVYKPSTNQGTEKEIVYRNYKLTNLVSVSIGGEKYRIRHSL